MFFETRTVITGNSLRYSPLRDHPRFQTLIEKYEKEHGVGDSQ